MNRRISFQTAAALGLSLSLALATRAEDWPQWRGPNRDGVWNETGVMESFPTGGLRISWRRPVGPGFSSPVVAQGRVYVTDSQVSGPKARERVLCFDAKTGNRLWTHAYEVDYADWAFDPKNITLNGKSALLFNDKGELIRADLDMRVTRRSAAQLCCNRPHRTDPGKWPELRPPMPTVKCSRAARRNWSARPWRRSR